MSSTIQFGGVISGLNTQGIVDALVAVKKQPLVDMQNQEATLTAQKAAYAQVGTALDDLVSKIQNFTMTSAGASHLATSEDTSVFSATADSSALVSQYEISVDRVATATRATSTTALGVAVTAADASKTLQSLNLPGSVTAGQISVIVDGTIVHYTVGDPATATLGDLMDGIGQAIQDQIVAGGVNRSADTAAAVTVSVAGNRLQISLSGAAASHSLSFGAAGDTSNALGMLGIANASATIAVGDPALTGTTNLGVARMTSALDSAGLSGLTSTTTGVLTLNGVDIGYDTTKDSISSLVTRINNSSAGVIASVDRINDQLVLTRKDTGAVAMDIEDNGTLATALKLAPGTTNAQKIGDTAQVTVDGRSIVSVSNTITNAVDGVTLNLVSKSPLGVPQMLTVGVDQDAVTSALNSFITSFNSLADTLDKLTAMTPGQVGGTAGTSGPLASDPTARGLLTSLRETLFGSSGSGTLNSLGAIGLNTGAIGAAAGTTDRLQLDTTKLTAAMSTDANRVASLLDGATGPLANLLTKLKTVEDPASTNSYIQAHTAGLGSEISELHRQEDDRTEMINNYQAAIEAQYAAMEATLSQLQAQSNSLAASLGTSTSSGSGLGASNA